MKKIVVVKNKDATYPSSDRLYAPDSLYPEYPFVNDSLSKKNDVYEMIRKAFYDFGLDADNYGKKNWNPLGEYIKSGDNVLLKPNWVMDNNPESRYHDFDCLITHPSIVRTIIDYVIIALKKNNDGILKGKIVVADAPMAECDFKELIRKCHYEELQKHYLSLGIKVEFIDMRGMVRLGNDNKLVGPIMTRSTFENSRIVNIGEKSAFEELSDECMGNLRALNNDPRVIQEHQKRHKHEYMLNKRILEADVIINLPKPKSHRKAGLTACAKNFVGANARKEFLPHACMNAVDRGGDMYKQTNIFYKMYYKLNDYYWVCRGEGKNVFGVRILYGLFRRCGKILCKEPYFDGSWYANDTIWRTIVDLNYAVKFADKKGVIKSQEQRKVFNICDMIISGEGEGPLMPSPKKENMIVMGESIWATDRFICHIFGFKEEYVKHIWYMAEQLNEADKIVIMQEGQMTLFDDFIFKAEDYIVAGYGWHGVLELKKDKR